MLRLCQKETHNSTNMSLNPWSKLDVFLPLIMVPFGNRKWPMWAPFSLPDRCWTPIRFENVVFLDIMRKPAEEVQIFNWAFLCSCTKFYRKVPPHGFNSMPTRFLPQFKPKIRFEVRFQFDTFGDTQHTGMFIMKIDLQATSISVDFGWKWKKMVSSFRHL